MNLTGQQQQQLVEALFDAYPAQNELDRMLEFRMELSVQRFASPNDDMPTVIFKLIKWTRGQGRLEELIDKAQAQTPSNLRLNEFVEELKRIRDEQKRTPKLGPVVYMSCDRIKQESDFNDLKRRSMLKIEPQLREIIKKLEPELEEI